MAPEHLVQHRWGLKAIRQEGPLERGPLISENSNINEELTKICCASW